MDHLIFESRFVYENIFCVFCDYLHVFSCVFFFLDITKLKLKLTEQENKAWVPHGGVGPPRGPFILS